jgi:hypothetical protein
MSETDWVKRGAGPTLLSTPLLALIAGIAIWVIVAHSSLWWAAAALVLIMAPFTLIIERLVNPSGIALDSTGVQLRVHGLEISIPWSQVRSIPRPRVWGGGVLVVARADRPNRLKSWMLSQRQVRAIAGSATTRIGATF